MTASDPARAFSPTATDGLRLIKRHSAPTVADLPVGTVTFLFTDVERSVRLWEASPAEMRRALVRHDEIVDVVVASHQGVLVRPRGEGDSRFAVFARATDGVAAACSLQRALLAEPWPTPEPLRVRIALHTGEADLRDGDYYGSVVNRCARLRAIARGGQVLLSGTTEALVRDALPANAGLKDLGERRLRDLARSERVYQLCHPELPAELSSLRALGSHPNNLPLQLTSFVGREREIAEIRWLLETTRLLTLTGAGGCGKTRLAYQVAAELVEDLPDGVWAVELAALSDPSLVDQTVASALGLREEPGVPILDTLFGHLKSRNVLLVLDNCEHLLDASARLADTLLKSCPSLRILATSREALGLYGETAYRVSSLSAPDPHERVSPNHLVARLESYESVRLFVDRARAVQPSFELGEQDASAVAQICWRLDGMPLAIELAAARVRLLTPEQIAQRLDDRFRLLTVGSRTALPHHQTLKAVLDWSFDLLSADERAVLGRLSTFVGGWTLEAAKEVCSGDGIDAPAVLDLLGQLVAKSLVEVRVSAGEARYGLAETTRQYGWERLMEAGEAQLASRRHRDWCLALAERAGSELWGPSQRDCVDRLDREHDNLRAALSRCLEGEAEIGLRLTVALVGFWERRGHLRECSSWLQRFLARSPGRTQLRARALASAAGAADGEGSVAEGLSLAEESLSIARELEDSGAAGRALIVLSWHHRFGGGALPLAEEAVAVLRAAGDPRALTGALLHLGNMLLFYDRGRATIFLEESLVCARSVGDVAQEAQALDRLGVVAYHDGDCVRARSLLEESLRLCREVADRPTAANSLTDLGCLALITGEHERARSLLEESLGIQREVVDGNGLIWSLIFLGHLARLEGEIVQARSFFGESLTRSRKQGMLRALGVSLAGLGLVSSIEGRDEEASARLREAMSILRQEPMRFTLGAHLWLWGLHEARRGRLGRGTTLVASAQAHGIEKTFLYAADKAACEGALASARAALGEEAFARARAEGQAMALEQAVEYALQEEGDG